VTIPQLDQQFFQLINHGFNSPLLDVVMALLSSWVFWKPLVFVAAALIVILGGFKERAFVCCALLGLLVADPGVANAIKQIVNRPRPYQAMAGVRVVRLQKTHPRFLAVIHPAVVTASRLPSKKRDNRSFPSGHVTNNAVIATLLTWFYRRRGWLYFIVVLLVTWSRVYVGDHYPTDVLAAVIIGAGVALIMMIFLEFLWRNGIAKLSPALASAHPTLVSR
jgi:undecaprenyl-diphosphatase